MAIRITCRTPSTGKSLKVTMQDVPAGWTTISEAPEFSIPDTSGRYTDRDSADDTRAIIPGEIFFLTPLSCRNKDTADHTLQVRLVEEDGTIIEFGDIEVPAGDTGFVPIQGRSLLKRVPTTTVDGDTLQIRADTANVFDVWSAAEEKPSSEHSGEIN